MGAAKNQKGGAMKKSDDSNVVSFPIKNRKPLDDLIDEPQRLLPRPVKMTKKQTEQSEKYDRFWNAVERTCTAYLDFEKYEEFEGEGGTREAALDAVCDLIEAGMKYEVVTKMLSKRSNHKNESWEPPVRGTSPQDEKDNA
jgi:hypothetical protein